MSICKRFTSSLAAIIFLWSAAVFAVQPLEVTEVYFVESIDESIVPHQLIITGRNFDNGSPIELWLGEVGEPLVIDSITELPDYFMIVADLPVGIPDGSYQLVATTGGGTVRFDAFDGVTIGAEGLQGEQGLQGDTGLTGEQGIQGEAGAQGPQGIQGEQGLQGIQGSQGPIGPQGLQGETGLIGPEGDTGPEGPQGPMGFTGSQGLMGAAGPEGPPGPDGPPGPSGIDCDLETRIKSAISSFVRSDECVVPQPPPPVTNARGIFVSPNGNDTNDGSMESPVATINKGLELAAALASDRNVNLLSTAIVHQYSSQGLLVLPDGVSIIGGFNASWFKDALDQTTRSEISVSAEGLVANDIVSTSAIENINLIARAATSYSGDSSYAVFARNSNGLVIRNAQLTAGNGASRPIGTPPAGQYGRPGGSGTAGTQGSGSSAGTGGSGGSNPFASDLNGGVGGKGGVIDLAEHGSVGGSGFCAVSAGGAGGSGGLSRGGDGSNGAIGAPGTQGANGQVGIGLFAQDGYAPVGGGNGTDGRNGCGGGGGGGGAAFNCTLIELCFDDYGSGGGGGGAGGTGGSSGTNGHSGGGSFGLYLWNSSPIVENVQIVTSTGGSGTSGGPGGGGGAGGAGSAGGAAFQDGGAGGNGGAGGDGGDGGDGAGGSGGPSIGILLGGGSAPAPVGVTYLLGTGGTGGLGGNSSNRGPNGLGAETFTP